MKYAPTSIEKLIAQLTYKHKNQSKIINSIKNKIAKSLSLTKAIVIIDKNTYTSKVYDFIDKNNI